MRFWKPSLKKFAKAETEKSSVEPTGSTMEMLERPGLTKQSFFLLYARLIEERLGARNLSFIEEGVLAFETATGKKLTTYMDNAWLQFAEPNEPRPDIIERYVAGLASALADTELTREQVIAIVKDSHYIAMLGDQPKVPIRHLAGDLWIVYADDLPKSTQSLTYEELSKLAVNEEELPALAVENLKRILPDIVCHGDGPWFLLTAGGDYVASILLLDVVWEQLAENVEGDLVAVAPSRDIVLLTGSASQDGLRAIRKKAEEIVSTGDHVISRTLLRRVDGRWINFD